ncbi:hypothetical protein [Trichocoleus sp. FACHB-90]|nr:hypothetical protein [Trichocoleus sp. FACHB-90]
MVAICSADAGKWKGLGIRDWGLGIGKKSYFLTNSSSSVPF